MSFKPFVTSRTKSKAPNYQDGRNETFWERGGPTSGEKVKSQDDAGAGASSSLNEIQDGLQILSGAQEQRKIHAQGIKCAVDTFLKYLKAQITLGQNMDLNANQIINIINASEEEENSDTLHQVTTQIFEKAVEDSEWSELYAKLSRRIMEGISSKVGLKTFYGYYTDGALFKKFMVDLCQEAFETTLRVDAAEESQSSLFEPREVSQSPNRQHLPGVAKFFAELFKVGIVVEKVMHERLKTFLLDVKGPPTTYLVSACSIVLIAGAQLDTPKAKGHMNIYLSRMQALTRNFQLAASAQRLIAEIIDARKSGWTKSIYSTEYQRTLKTNEMLAASLASRQPASASNNLDGLGEISPTTKKGRVESRFDHKDVRMWRQSAQTFFEAKCFTDNCLLDVPEEKRGGIVEQLTLQALRMGEADAWLLAALFAYAKSKGLCSPKDFEIGFSEAAPWVSNEKSLASFKLVVKGAGLGESERGRIFELLPAVWS